MKMHHLHIFLSSPGDVSRERQLAREVIDRIQSERAYRNRLKLEVVAWDKPGAGTRMPAHLEPQEAINRGLKKPSECEVVIVIFWARMGTPLSENHLKPEDSSRYRSGTEYEFLDGFNAAKEAGKPEVWVYRRGESPLVPLGDPEHDEKKKQWDLVQAFFKEFRNPDGSYRIFCKEYNEPSGFKDLLDEDLRDFVTSYLEDHPLDTVEVSMSPEEPIWEPSRAPYPGLRAFVPEEAIIFYGRGKETDALVNELSQPNKRLIAVVGASGSGKSSLVAAGVLPALENDAIYGSKDWAWLRFTPAEVGDNPFMALANAFKPILEKRGIQTRKMADALEADPGAIKAYVTMALDGKPEWAELLVFIDQFEEFFTLVAPAYHQRFVDLLALASETPRVRCVVTMRSDFYHRCLDWPVLNKLFAEGQYTLLAPGVGALHEMITRPANRAGLTFEQGLAQRILDDTGTESGALALMAFALSELWKKSAAAGGKLIHAAYESFDGVHGAIGKRAEDTFKGLEGDEKTLEMALGNVFRDLVEVDERGVATRRRADLNQVTAEAVTRSLVDGLIEARLLVTSRGEDNAAQVEVAHEAIFTHWPRLKDWIEVRRDDLRLLRQVRLAAAEWDKNGRAAHYLWPHERLLPVAQMVDRMRPVLSSLEQEFIRPESDRLLKLIDDPATTHLQRVKIGDRLSEIGDPRPGVGLWEDGLPNIAWCEVPGGKIIPVDKSGTFEVMSFFIAKYPVTWIQYRTFLEAEDGYRNKGWWKGLADREDVPGEQYRQQDNHPAETVSWYDAVAYCRWLSKRLGYDIRLPTEWEWQQAATGGDRANEYPWGRDWDSERCNTEESGLSRTTAVGLYPKGASPVGALDMSGNVWEWCLNEYHNPRKVAVSGYESRVVRGGSWYYGQYSVREARRYDHQYYRYHDFGFRLCCRSPIL